MHTERDSKLVMQCKQGDRLAMEALVSHYERPVYSLSYRLLGNREDACNVTKKAFIRAFDTIHRVDKNTTFFSWIYRIAVNESSSQLKQRNRSQSSNKSVTDTSEPEADLDPGQVRLNNLAQLNRLLAESREARDQQTALQKLNGLLSSLPPQLPPLALHDQILDGIRLPSQEKFGLFRNRSINTITRLGYVVVASILLGVGLYVFNPDKSGRPDAGRVIGTGTAGENHSADVAIDEFSFSIADLSSGVRLREIEGNLFVDLAMDAKIPVEIELDMISGKMQFAELNLTNGWRGHLTEGNQSVFLHNMGQQHLTMQLSESGTAASTRHKTRIKVSYFIRGNRVQEHLLVNPH